MEKGTIVENTVDQEYFRLVEDVLSNGVLKPTRAKIDGKNVAAKSVFGRQARFSLTEGLPILTSKKVSFHNILHELIWYFRGDSNIQYLKDHNVHIWDKWADDKGELGFGTYGTLWRQFPFHVYDDEMEKYYGDRWYEDVERSGYSNRLPNYDKSIQFNYYETDVVGKVDQIRRLLTDIEKVKEDPTASCGRRLMVTAWHPYYTDKVGLPPCHCLFQFNVTGNRLLCQLYQRSCDLFLGVPYNITSYCLLTYIVAHLTGLVPYEFIHTYGDLHIYENHEDQLREQLSRQTHNLPKLVIDPAFTNIDEIDSKYFRLDGYKNSGVLTGEVAV